MSNIFDIMPVLDWMIDLGDQIRAAREGRNMSQEQLASKVGKSRGSINLYENGKGNPEFQVIAAIAEVLGKEFSVLGCTIGPRDLLRRPDPAQQLCLEFDHDHKFLAVLTIRPSQMSVMISAEAKVGDKLA
jgi:transcriptional regulator with XRE-family HTH domain